MVKVSPRVPCRYYALKLTKCPEIHETNCAPLPVERY